MIFEARAKAAPGQSRGADRPSHDGFLPSWPRPPSGRWPGAGSAGPVSARASGSVGPHATATTIRPLSIAQSVFDLQRWGSPFVPVLVLECGRCVWRRTGGDVRPVAKTWRRRGGGRPAPPRLRGPRLVRPTGVDNRVERGAWWPQKQGFEVRPLLRLSPSRAGSWWRWHVGRERPLMRLGGVCGGRVGDDRQAPSTAGRASEASLDEVGKLLPRPVQSAKGSCASARFTTFSAVRSGSKSQKM